MFREASDHRRVSIDSFGRSLQHNRPQNTDLVRMDVELLCQLDDGLLLARSIMPLLRRKSTYPGCSDFRCQLCRVATPAH